MGFENSNLPNQILFDNQKTSNRVMIVGGNNFVNRDVLDEIVKRIKTDQVDDCKLEKKETPLDWRREK